MSLRKRMLRVAPPGLPDRRVEARRVAVDVVVVVGALEDLEPGPGRRVEERRGAGADPAGQGARRLGPPVEDGAAVAVAALVRDRAERRPEVEDRARLDHVAVDVARRDRDVVAEPVRLVAVEVRGPGRQALHERGGLLGLLGRQRPARRRPSRGRRARASRSRAAVPRSTTAWATSGADAATSRARPFLRRDDADDAPSRAPRGTSRPSAPGRSSSRGRRAPSVGAVGRDRRTYVALGGRAERDPAANGRRRDRPRLLAVGQHDVPGHPLGDGDGGGDLGIGDERLDRDRRRRRARAWRGRAGRRAARGAPGRPPPGGARGPRRPGWWRSRSR